MAADFFDLANDDSIFFLEKMFQNHRVSGLERKSGCEAAIPHFFGSFKAQSSTGTCFSKFCSTKYYSALRCASFVIQSTTGRSFVQALSYEDVLRCPFSLLCSAKCFVQALLYKIVLLRAVCELYTTQ